MSKFLLLLLLSSSKFEFGEFQQIPKAEPILELIRRSSSINYLTASSEIQSIFDAINGSANYAGPLKLQYNLNDLEDTLNIDDLIMRESIDVDNKGNGSLSETDTDQIMPFVRTPHGIAVKSAVKDIREGKYKPHSSLRVTAKNLVERHYLTILRSFAEIWTPLATSEHDSTTDGKKGKGLSGLYQLLTTNTLHRCGTGTSPQQALMRLYAEIMKTDIIITEALILLTLLKNVKEQRYTGNGEVWATVRNQFILRYNAYAYSFSTAFDEASREHRSCDPNKKIGWKRGTSFFELERFIQATAFHRSVSESRRAQWPSCDDWAIVLMDKRDDNSTCKGADSDACWMDPVERCHEFLSSCSPMDVARCINDPANPRRYAWIRTTSSPKYNESHTNCSGEGRHLNEGFGDTCMCRCYQGDNTVSLDLSLSDIKENRVITAMRLAQKDKTIFIQIKQGKLQPDGRILNESTSWEPSSPAVFNRLQFYAPGQVIFLDDLQGADDEVLTGIGFMSISRYYHGGIKLRIRVTKFNYTEGYLAHKSRVIAASRVNRVREMLETNNPLDSHLENVPTISLKDSFKRFVTIEPSNFMNDAGQTTLPLFDAIPVEGRPASPLSGAGIFKKKITGYGGFVSLRAIGMNLAKYFKESVRQLPFTPTMDPQ